MSAAAKMRLGAMLLHDSGAVFALEGDPDAQGMALLYADAHAVRLRDA